MGEQVWLADRRVGDRWTSPETTVTAEEIMAFGQAWDPQPGHLNPELAQATPFGALAASGWHTAVVSMRLLSPFVTGMVARSVQLEWPTPTRPGDRLHVEARVVAVRDSRRHPDRLVVEVEYDTLTQQGEVRQQATAVLVAWRPRPAS
jgi:acyl dehydratase